MRMTSGMKRKVAVLAACLVVGLFPAAVYAADGATCAHTGMDDNVCDICGCTVYSVFVNEIQVTSLNKDDVLNDGKVKFTPAAGNATDTLTITGDVTITNEFFGIGASAPLTITGTGSITIGSSDSNVNQYAIAASGGLTIDGVDITAYTDGIAIQTDQVGGSGSVTIKNAVVNVESRNNSIQGYGITIENSVVKAVSEDGIGIRCLSEKPLTLGDSVHLVSSGSSGIRYTSISTPSGYCWRSDSNGTFQSTGLPTSALPNDYLYFEYVSADHLSTPVYNDSTTHTLSCTNTSCLNKLTNAGAAHTTVTYTVNTNDSTKHDVTYGCCGGSDSETHTPTYTSNGNVITEGCEKNCGYNEIAILTAPAVPPTYDGTAKEGAKVAYSGGWTGGRSLAVTYADNINAGAATASITFGGVTASATYAILPRQIAGAAVAIEREAGYVYSGAPLTPQVASVTLDGTPLAAADYQVSYSDNVNAGTAAVTVTGRGNYSGSATASFTIAKAPAPTLPAVTASRNYALGKVSVPTGVVAGEGGSVSVGTVGGSAADKFSGATIDSDGSLTLAVSGGESGDTAVVPVTISSRNFEDATVEITVTLTDKLDQRSLTVNAASPTVAVGGTLELSTSGGSGRGAVTYEVVSGTGSASVRGGTLTGGSPGTVTVIATKAGTSQYNPARSQPLVITVE